MRSHSVISQLLIQRFRNLSFLDLSPGPSFNLVIGANGSGKSSILEAIHILATGRSFRTHLNPRIIQYGEEDLCVYASLQDKSRIGVEKSRTKSNRIHLNGSVVRSQAELAGLIPFQLIHPEGYELITGPGKFRRQYLDWGSFHVEHQFFGWWQRAQRVLQHRNIALRQQASKNELLAWNQELIEMAELIDKVRGSYFHQLEPVINRVLSQFLAIDISFHYYRGWDSEESLLQALQHSEQGDRSLGFTQRGPHRADVKIKVGKLPAADALSRGQLKLLVCALRLAQGMDYQQQLQRPCLFLLDDLASELDVEKRQLLLQALDSLRAQVFITSVEAGQLGDFASSQGLKMFHVEQMKELS